MMFFYVIPAQAGILTISEHDQSEDSRLRGNDAIIGLWA